MIADGFVATSIARRLIARMQITHERRRISVFSGPPGIGKTTAIDRFSAAMPGSVAVVKVEQANAREILVLRHVLQSVRKLSGSMLTSSPSSVWHLREAIFETLNRWTLNSPPDDVRLTIVFDEAQNLSRQVIEALRYWNDTDRCYAPFPIGMVFVGNHEFSLAGNGSESVISAAVADRALYLQTFEYDDVTDEDLRLFIEAIADIEDDAARTILRSFKSPRAVRSFRRVTDLIRDLQASTGSQSITSEAAREALSLA